MLSLGDSKTASKNTLTKTQVSKSKAAVVHPPLKTRKNIQKPQVAVVHAKVSHTLRHSEINAKEA